MRIAMKGRNVPVGDELRERVNKKFAKIARQVSPLADMEVELIEERNPSIKQSQVVEVTLHLKGVTLRAREASESMARSVNLASEDLARQVKRHREKRRKRREAHRASGQGGDPGLDGLGGCQDLHDKPESPQAVVDHRLVRLDRARGRLQFHEADSPTGQENQPVRQAGDRRQEFDGPAADGLDLDAQSGLYVILSHRLPNQRRHQSVLQKCILPSQFPAHSCR